MSQVGGVASPAFSGFRIIHNDGRRIGFEVAVPNEKMSKIKQHFQGQPLLLQFYDGKIKVYSKLDYFDKIICALSVF